MSNDKFTKPFFYVQTDFNMKLISYSCHFVYFNAAHLDYHVANVNFIIFLSIYKKNILFMWPDDRTRILQRFQPHGFCTNLEEVVFYSHFLHLFLFLFIQNSTKISLKKKCMQNKINIDCNSHRKTFQIF